RMLGENFNVSRVTYGAVEGEDDRAEIVVQGQYIENCLPFPERFPYSVWAGGFVADLGGKGLPLVVRNAHTDHRFNEAVRAEWLAMSVRSAIVVTITKGGRAVMFGLHHSQPRSWNSEDVLLVTEVAERTWEAAQRARAEAAVRSNEERQAFLLRL